MSRHVVDFAVSLARASRPGDDEAIPLVKRYVEWGAGPRASQYLILGAKTRAILDGRPTPSVEDVRYVARIIPTLSVDRPADSTIHRQIVLGLPNGDCGL